MPELQVMDFKIQMGSFSNIKGGDNDPKMATVAYCLTDNPCNHWEVRDYAYTDHAVRMQQDTPQIASMDNASRDPVRYFEEGLWHS